jgi:hypothetical protein
MRYTGHIEILFDYEIPEPESAGSYLDRNLATASGSTDVLQGVLDHIATDALAGVLGQFDNGHIEMWAIPEAKSSAA